jgi:hypothetical protein
MSYKVCTGTRFHLIFALCLLFFFPVGHALVQQASTSATSVPSIRASSILSHSPSAAPFQLSNSTSGSLGAPKNTTHYYRPLYEKHFNSTPGFQNVTGKTSNPLIIALDGAKDPVEGTLAPRSLKKRDLPVGTCAPGTPCVNGACCSNVSEMNILNLLFQIFC